LKPARDATVEDAKSFRSVETTPDFREEELESDEQAAIYYYNEKGASVYADPAFTKPLSEMWYPPEMASLRHKTMNWNLGNMTVSNSLDHLLSATDTVV